MSEYEYGSIYFYDKRCCRKEGEYGFDRVLVIGGNEEAVAQISLVPLRIESCMDGAVILQGFHPLVIGFVSDLVLP